MGWKVLQGEPLTSPTLKDFALATVSGLGHLKMGIVDQTGKSKKIKTASEHLLDDPLVSENLQGYKSTKNLSDFIKILTKQNLCKAKKQGHPNNEINLRIFSKGYDKGKYVSITPDPDDIKDFVEYAHLTISLDDADFGISNIQARSKIVRDRIVGEAYLNTNVPISQAYVPTAFAGLGNDYLGSSKKAVPVSELADHIIQKKFFEKLEEAAKIRPLNDRGSPTTPQQFVLHLTTSHKVAGNPKVTASFETYDPTTFEFGKDRNIAVIIELSPERKIIVKEIIKQQPMASHAPILQALGISTEDQQKLTTGLVKKEKSVKPSPEPEAPEAKPDEKKPEGNVPPQPEPILANRPCIRFTKLHNQWVQSSPHLDTTTRTAIEEELESVGFMLAQIEIRYPSLYNDYSARIQRWYQIHSSGKTNGHQMLNTIQQRKMGIAHILGLPPDTFRMAS